MTRKRFVKLMMAYGSKRNDANEYAKTYRMVGIPYKSAMAIKEIARDMDRAIIGLDTMRL